MHRSWVVVAAVAVSLVAPSWAAADNIRIESTTDTVDAGLVEGLLRPAYAKAQPGDTLAYHGTGTGTALMNARAGLADVVITHAPSLEAQFVADGYSLGLGRQIFYSDYVIVGPSDDPAGVQDAHPHDAAGAFEDIAAAGEDDSDAVRFYSRGESSGTNVEEQIIWGLTSSVTKQQAINASGNAARFEPGSGGTYPAWYVKSGDGQLKNLQDAATCSATDGCYTIVDRGTYNKAINDGTVTGMKIVADKNTAGAPGGENLLVNPFSVYIVDPEAIDPSKPVPNVAAATRFVDFLVSPDFQAAVAGFPSSIDPAFRPDAFPDLTLDPALPPTAAPGDDLTISGVAKNRLPGGGTVADLPMQLQQSRDGGKTWRDVGGPIATDEDGAFSFDVTMGKAATSYRVTTPAHPAPNADPPFNQFSPATQDLGVIGVPAEPSPSPGPSPGGGGGSTTPPVITPVTPDTTAPRVTSLRLTRHALRLHVSEASRITVVIQRRIKRKGKTRYRTVTTLHLTTGQARTLSRLHRTLASGRYRLRVTATDRAGNRRRLVRAVNRR